MINNSPVLRVIKREFDIILKKKPLVLLSLAAPVLFFLLFALIFKNGVLRDIPIAIYDEDNSTLSLLITRYVESTGSMAIVKYVHSLDELKSEFRKGKIDAAFYLPRNMEKDVKGGRQSHPVLFINSMNLIKSNNILNDGEKVIKTVSGGILLKKIRSSGSGEKQAMDIINPIKIDSQIMFNPNYSYEQYLFPGLAAFTLMMIIMLTSVLVLNSEFSNNTLGELISTGEGRLHAVIIGKSIPYILIHLINILILAGIILPLFQIGINTQVIYTILFFLLFVIVSFTAGMAVSVFINDQMFATELILFVNTPAFIFSGLTFPLWSMPKVIAAFAQIIPYTHFLSGFMKLYLWSAPPRYAIPDTKWLLCFLVIFIIVITFGLKRRIRIYNRGNI
jgi:ABC-2 type transport system permease protein